MWKKIISTCLVLTFIIAGFLGVSRFTNPQEPLELERVNDTIPTAEISATGEQGKAGETNNSGMKLAAKAAVLIDGSTGKVLFEQDSHKELPPASVTKVMTMLLTMEAVERGQIKLTDIITISERAASMGGSQMYMEVGEQHTLEELLEGIAIVSANDACVAVAEYVAGSEEIFVEQMNARARELGMRDTNFVNTNGLPVANHYTSAYDIGLMSCHLIKHEETKKWFNTWQKTIKVGLPGKEKEFGLTNTNKLIKAYPGANGIKTGFTAEAGYCLSASATKEDTTLIAVALGCETAKIRTAEISKLFNYGFAMFQSVEVAARGQVLKSVELIKGEPYKVNAVTREKVTVVVPKGKAEAASCKAIINKDIKLPLVAGDEIGKLKVYVDDREVAEYALVAQKSVERASLLTYYIRKIKRLF